MFVLNVDEPVYLLCYKAAAVSKECNLLANYAKLRHQEEQQKVK